MEALRQYLRDLFTGWQGVMSSTASIVFLVVGFIFKLADLGQLRYWLIASFVCFFIAAYWAWHRQYTENRIGREIGSLAFEGLTPSVTWHDYLLDLQINIILKNLQPRLLKYRLENYKVVIEGREFSLTEPFPEIFVYANKETRFSCETIKDIPLDKNLLLGKLEYVISYSFIGSKHVHHSSKECLLEIRHAGGSLTPALELRWTIKSESEDEEFTQLALSP